MSLDLNYTFEVSKVDGTLSYFTDTTANYGQGGNIPYGSVLRTRLVLGSYLGDLDTTDLVEGDTIERWREIQKTSLAPSTYDGKIIVVGQRYIPFVTTLTVLTGDTFSTTGRWSEYITPATYLPTANQLPLTRTPQQFGFSTDVTVFPDRLYYAQYEVYTNTSPSTITNATAGATYMCSGNVTYNGSTYGVGEVFTANDNGTVSMGRGTVVYIQAAAKFQYFLFLFETETRINQLILQLRAACGCNDNLEYQVFKVRMTLEALKAMDIMNRTDATKAQSTLEQIFSELTLLEQCVANC